MQYQSIEEEKEKFVSHFVDLTFGVARTLRE